MEHLFNIFDQFVHADWFNTALGAVAILLVTLVISRVTVS